MNNDKPHFYYGYVIAAAALFILVVTYGAYYSYGVFFKPVLEEFKWTRALASGAYSLSFLMSGLMGIVMGGITDKLGPRIVSTICGVSLGLCFLLMANLNAIWQIYLFYGVLAGIGMSGGIVPLTATVARWFARRRGMMTGIVVAGVGTGTVIMPPIATRLISVYEWRTSYIIVGIATLILAVLAAQFVRRDPGKMGLLPDGEGMVREQSPALAVGGFSLREAVTTRRYWMLCAMYLCFGFCMQTILLHIVPHATDIGITPIAASTILSTIGGLSIVGRITIGSVSDRIGTGTSLAIALALLTAALFWLLAANELWMLYLFATVFGLGYGGMVALESPTVASIFGLRSHGLILGTVLFNVTIGGAVGPLLAGRIFDITSSYQPAFYTLAGVITTGLIIAFFLGPIRRKSMA